MGEDEPEKMKTHIVIDGNAFYEIDEECLSSKGSHRERIRNRKIIREMQKGKEPYAGKKVCVAFRAHTSFERKENLEVQTTVSVAA